MAKETTIGNQLEMYETPFLKIESYKKENKSYNMVYIQSYNITSVMAPKLKRDITTCFDEEVFNRMGGRHECVEIIGDGTIDINVARDLIESFKEHYSAEHKFKIVDCNKKTKKYLMKEFPKPYFFEFIKSLDDL